MTELPETTTLGTADFDVPVDDRYLEDYRAGAVYEYGRIEVTAEAIVDFAGRWDPQAMHVDAAWAQTGPFGGLIASGFHTAGICMQLFVGHYLSHVASLASPGIDELRWPVPVRPGDVLWLRATILEARRSGSRPDRGVVRTRLELFDQADRLVLHMVPVNILARRDGDGPRPGR